MCTVKSYFSLFYSVVKGNLIYFKFGPLYLLAQHIRCLSLSSSNEYIYTWDSISEIIKSHFDVTESKRRTNLEPRTSNKNLLNEYLLWHHLKSLHFCFYTFDARRSFGVLHPENQTGSRSGSRALGLTEDVWHQKYKNKKDPNLAKKQIFSTE